MRQRKTIPREKVEALAKLVAEKRALDVNKAHTQAKMIRGCIAALKQTESEAKRRLEHEHFKAGKKGVIGYSAPHRKIINDRALAFLHLEWLATQLEDVR